MNLCLLFYDLLFPCGKNLKVHLKLGHAKNSYLLELLCIGAMI